MSRPPIRKSTSRQDFEEIFEQQTRRFSAFDILGLSHETPSPSDDSDAYIADKKPYTLTESPPSDHGHQVPSTDRRNQVPRVSRQHQVPGADRQHQVPGADRQHQVPGADRQHQEEEVSQSPEIIPLAPLQWEVLKALKEMSETEEILSYRQIGERISAHPMGVKRAVRALGREGAFLSKTVVKTSTAQGIQVKVNPQLRFRLVSRREAYGLTKRGQHLVPRTDRRYQVSTVGQHSMYVFKKNTYIQKDDISVLLRLPPSEWQIREQTLIQIADSFPTMTALEFRLSLRRLVEQASNGKQVIQNPNAWLKAAFEKNGGPLVTEREIEVRLEQGAKMPQEQPPHAPESESQDLDVLRRYVAASPEERAKIDQIAENRVGRMLATVSSDKHHGIREQARIEVAREFFAERDRSQPGGE